MINKRNPIPIFTGFFSISSDNRVYNKPVKKCAIFTVTYILTGKALLNVQDQKNLSRGLTWRSVLHGLGSVVKAAGAVAPEEGLRASDVLESWKKLDGSAETDFFGYGRNSEMLFKAPYVPVKDSDLEKYPLTALVATAYEKQENAKNTDSAHWLPSLLMAGVLGEVVHNLPYHNNLHFRKVTLHAARLIDAHNADQKQKDPLTPRECALLLIAACIHDLGHDGTGNVGPDGAYSPGRLERRSFEYARPYLEQAGMDQESLSVLETMMICTDASRPDNPACPLTQLRSAASFHFTQDQTHAAGSGTLFNRLKDNRKTALLSLFLHEADIMNSAGVSVEQTSLETCQFRKESQGAQARPSDVLEFMGTICRGGFISQAGKTLGQKAYETIRTRAHQDFEKGNEPYTLCGEEEG